MQVYASRKPGFTKSNGKRAERHILASRNLTRLNALLTTATHNGFDCFIRDAEDLKWHLEVFCTRAQWRRLKLQVRWGWPDEKPLAFSAR